MLESDAPLSRVISLALAAIIVVVTLFNTYCVDRGLAELATSVSGQSLEILASQLQDKIDRTLAERQRDMRDAAVLAAEPGRTQSLKNIFDALVRKSNFTWIALVQPGGGIVTEAGLRPQGVVSEEWPFLREPGAIGNAGDGVRIRANQSSYAAEGEPKTLAIDIAVPVSAGASSAAAAICARLDESFLMQLVRSAWDEHPVLRATEVFVVSGANEIILGPPGVRRLPPQIESSLRTVHSAPYFLEVQWPEGGIFNSGFARTNGHQEFPTLGWTVIARQPASAWSSPLSALQKRIWLLAVFFLFHGIALAWFMARVVSEPLLRLARWADALRKGAADQLVPSEFSYHEARLLSHSLHSLIEDLRVRERAQSELAASLELQVEDRTRQLSERNRSLEQANARAEEAVQSKSRFLAAASHDLRQPLQALMLITRRLARRIKDGEDGALVTKVEQSIGDLTNMFNALLDMSRLDSGTIEAEVVAFDLAALLERIAEDFGAEIDQTQLEFRFRCPQCSVMADPVLIEAMVRNLLSNAAKFTAEGGILLCARRAGHAMEIRVYDTGPGIEAERLSGIFDEFVRSHMKASGPNPGLGLGLSIVKRHAELTGAEISVRSKVGSGSCFSISVPLVGSANVERPDRVRELDPGYWSARRVLLLDDDSIVLEALAAELEERGAFVEAFSSIETAECAVASRPAFDVIIADYDLRGSETGVDFLKRAKSRQIAPFGSLVLTGRTDPKTIAIIAESGSPWLAKPADPQAIETLLAG